MSCQLVFAGAALRRHFPFADGPAALALSERLRASPRLAAVTAASRLEVRPAPAMASSGIGEIDFLTGGFPRGCLSEVCGPPSSGRSSVLLAAVAAATRRQEACALVDAGDALDPQGASLARVELRQLLWIRCSPCEDQDRGAAHGASGSLPAGGSSPGLRSRPGRAWEHALQQALQTTDLLLQSSGFGMVAIDLADVPVKFARRIPLTTWFRFRRAVENTATVLLVIGRQSCAQTCASLVLQLDARAVRPVPRRPPAGSAGSAAEPPEHAASPAHARILEGLQVKAELLHSRLDRKAPQSVTVFDTRSAWQNR